jgi:hypothetical protein
MNTFYVIDSSMYYISKLMSVFANKTNLSFFAISLENNSKNKEIIYIVNDLNDFIEYLVIREKYEKVHLVVTNTFLKRKLSLTETFDFYTY